MRIGSLEFRDKNGYEMNPTKEQMAIVIDSQQRQIAVLEKALKLACKKIFTTNSNPHWYYDDTEKQIKNIMDGFKQQAEKELKNEKNS